MSTNVVMPQLGESVVEGTVGKWLKNVGDTVAQYEPIMEVITDKVTTEIPSPAAGTLVQILVPEGTTVQAGTVVALIGQSNEVASAAPVNPATVNRNQLSVTSDQSAVISDQSPIVSNPAPVSSLQSPTNGSARNRLTPVVARMISEYNISDAELKSINGTGENGRVSKKDIETFLLARTERSLFPNASPQRSLTEPQRSSAESPRAAPAVETLPPWEQPGTGELFRPTEEVFGRPTTASVPPLPMKEGLGVRDAGVRDAGRRDPGLPDTGVRDAGLKEAPAPQDTELVPFSPMRRAIAEHMVRSKTVAPHVTTVHEADMSRVLAHFAKHQDEFARQNVKLTYTPYFIQAVISGLHQVPMVNAQWTEQGIAMKRDLNIGVAVALEEGLIVPVIKHADDKSLLGLARAVNDLAARAREKRLNADEVAGGTFTLTNYGVFGSLFGTPVISQPQSAILGVGAIQKRVVVINDAIAIRPMVYLALSFDHRLLDGAVGDTFMNKVKQFLENYPEP